MRTTGESDTLVGLVKDYISTTCLQQCTYLTLASMSYFLLHLPSGWDVDEAIKPEGHRILVIRFGHDWDQQCMTMDETFYSVADCNHLPW